MQARQLQPQQLEKPSATQSTDSVTISWQRTEPQLGTKITKESLEFSFSFLPPTPELDYFFCDFVPFCGYKFERRAAVPEARCGSGVKSSPGLMN